MLRQIIISFVWITLMFMSSSSFSKPSKSASGAVRITMEKTSSIKLGGLEGGDFLSADTLAANGTGVDLCVYTTNTQYGVSLSSQNGTDDSFRISNGEEYVDYEVLWNDSKQTGNNLSTAANPYCDEENNANLKMYLRANEVRIAQLQGYTDTLTLMLNSY